MTTFLLLILDQFFGRAILAPHPVLVALAITSGVIEFHYKGWQQFMAVMRLMEMNDLASKDPRRALTPAQLVLGECTLYVGLFWDVVLNLLASFWLLQWPWRRTSKPPHYPQAWKNAIVQRTWLLSSRLEENVFGRGTTWQWQEELSNSFRQQLLDNGDPRGIHRS